MSLTLMRFAALLLSALSLGPSFAHVLEAGPRLKKWSPTLWRETTVFRGQFQLFGVLGGPLDGGAILAIAAMTYYVRDQHQAFWLGLLSTASFALSLIVWLGVVAPANVMMSKWKPGPIAENFRQVRARWEGGHMIMASLKLLGFTAILLSVVLP